MLAKYSIRIAERVISVSLEREFWDALRDIAADRNTTLSAILKEIIGKIDGNPDGRRVASVLRVYILEQYLPSKRLDVPGNQVKRHRETTSALKYRK